jgi:hypothetical protein
MSGTVERTSLRKALPFAPEYRPPGRKLGLATYGHTAQDEPFTWLRDLTNSNRLAE